MKLTMQCLFSPRLYKIYNDVSRENMYKPNSVEKWADKVIYTAQTIYSIGLYTSPLIVLYLYRRGMFNYEESRYMFKIVGGISCFLAFSILMRGLGRAYNAKYVDFLRALNDTSKDPKAYLTSMREYDFDFSAWPISYKALNDDDVKHKTPLTPTRENMDLPPMSRGLLQFVAYICTHTFALRLIYPGTLAIIQIMLGSALEHGRTQLVEASGGQRSKVLTADGNAIDTMFVDKRGQSANGETLVICCEGNTGFYEVGIMSTAFKANYSALGWNHPGFGASTGMPFPSQEQRAIEAVVKYAIEELGFKEEQLVFFGWSIGGYTAAWGAQRYHRCRALILDATFDDILPLAERQMPAWWARLVRQIIRSYVDLRVGALLAHYRGPVLLVRRTHDEIICLKQGDMSTNCGNELVLRVISARHADTAREHAARLTRYVALSASQREKLANMEDDQDALQIAHLISRYMRDYSSTHCSPLPESDFATIMRTLDPKQA